MTLLSPCCITAELTTIEEYSSKGFSVKERTPCILKAKTKKRNIVKRTIPIESLLYFPIFLG